MSIKKADFDSLPELDDDATFKVWEQTVLSLVAEFSLSETLYATIEGRYQTIAELFEKPSNLALDGVHFYPQGSFLTHTVIKPPSAGEIDVDAIVWSPNPARLTAKELYDAVYEELNARVRTAEEVQRKNRCSRIQYADTAPAFHMDVTPAVNALANSGKEGTGKLLVPDLKEIEAGAPGWKSSAPKLFADWVNDSAKNFEITLKAEFAAESMTMDSARGSSEPLPGKVQLDYFDPLRATIKLLKFHREKFFADRSDKDFMPISVLLTTLACKAYRRIATQSMAAPLSAMEAIIAIVDELDKHFDRPTDVATWRLCNPVLPDENFAERWNDAKDGYRRVQAFEAWHEQIRIDVRLGLKAFKSKEEFTRTVVEAIGPRGAKTMLDERFDRAIATGGATCGLSAVAIESAASASAANRIFGIGQSQPRQEAEPPRRLA